MDQEERWNAAVGETIRAERAARNMTQVDVAKGAGIPRQTFIRYETGTRVPNVTQVAFIARALGMTPSAFIAEITRRAE